MKFDADAKNLQNYRDHLMKSVHILTIMLFKLVPEKCFIPQQLEFELEKKIYLGFRNLQGKLENKKMEEEGQARVF